MNKPYVSPAVRRPILIGVPCGDMIHADFTQALLHMCLQSQTDSLYLGVNFTKSTLIDVGRNVIVRESLEANASHLLFIDSDIVCQPDTLRRLLSHGKDIVGATYCGRRSPRRLNHLNLDGTSTLEKDSGLYKVRSLPGGLVLINTDVFRAMPPPWYSVKWLNEKGYLSEDVNFCHRAGAAGIGYNIWLDVELSKSIRHCGQAHYSLEDMQYSTLAHDMPTDG